MIAFAEADVGMQHDRLRLAGDRGIAVRHRHGGVLVRHHQRPGHFAIRPCGAGERLDNGGEIGAGIGEEILDPVVCQGLQVVLGGNLGHGGFPALRMACQTRSGVAGMSIWRTPSGASASSTALMTV